MAFCTSSRPCVLWCDGPQSMEHRWLRGPRYGPLHARTTPCCVTLRHPRAGLIAGVPCGGLSARTPPRLPLSGCRTCSLFPTKPRRAAPRSSGREQCSGWGWQQPGAARGRQFLGPACRAAISHIQQKQQQKQQYTGSRPLSTTVDKLSGPGRSAVIYPCSACCCLAPWPAALAATINGVFGHQVTHPDRCLSTPPSNDGSRLGQAHVCFSSDSHSQYTGAAPGTGPHDPWPAASAAPPDISSCMQPLRAGR
jgi:hypothetical protein